MEGSGATKIFGRHHFDDPRTRFPGSRQNSLHHSDDGLRPCIDQEKDRREESHMWRDQTVTLTCGSIQMNDESLLHRLLAVPLYGRSLQRPLYSAAEPQLASLDPSHTPHPPFLHQKSLNGLLPPAVPPNLRPASSAPSSNPPNPPNPSPKNSSNA